MAILGGREVKIILERAVEGDGVAHTAFGGNGGDGIAIGRILHQHGYRVQIALVCDKDSNPDTTLKKNCAKAYGIPMDTSSNVRATKSQMEWDIIVDAVLGI